MAVGILPVVMSALLQATFQNYKTEQILPERQQVNTHCVQNVMTPRNGVGKQVFSFFTDTYYCLQTLNLGKSYSWRSLSPRREEPFNTASHSFHCLPRINENIASGKETLSRGTQKFEGCSSPAIPPVAGGPNARLPVCLE